MDDENDMDDTVNDTAATDMDNTYDENVPPVEWKDVVLDYNDDEDSKVSDLLTSLQDKGQLRGEDPLGIIATDLYIRRTNVQESKCATRI
jgi:hypothetical protein